MPPNRLPIVNSDDGVWGDILRQYLMKEHYNDDTDNPQNGGHQFVTIRPGTTSQAPLTLTAGSLLSVPAVGSIEFNSGKLYFTTTGSVRKTVAMYDTSGADGDLFYRNSTGTLSRLPIGNTNDVLTVSGGMPIWQPNSAANAVLKSDTATTGYGFVVDEDNMTSNSATKVPTQQSVKAYVDAVAKQHLNPTDVKTSNYSAVAGDYVLVDGDETFTVYLPAAPNDGDTVGLYRLGNNGEVTLDSSGKDLMTESSGLTALPLNTFGVTMAVLVYDAARDHWFVTSYIAHTDVSNIIGAGAAGKDILYQDTPDEVLSHGLGITATVTELNYVDGVTGNIQTQLDAKASASHTHTASQISDSTTTGRAVLTAASAAAARTAIGALATSVVIDEDTMVSNLDTHVPTQQSVKAYVDNSLANALAGKQKIIRTGSTSTAATTAAKVVTVGDGSYVPVVGDMFLITFDDGSTIGSPTLNINGSGAKSVRTPGGDMSNWSLWLVSGASALFWYDGTYYNTYPTANDYPEEISQAEIAATTSSDTFLISGRRIEYMSNREASQTRTLTNKRIISRVVTPGVASTYTINSDITDLYNVSGQTSNVIFNNPSGTPTNGQKLMVRIKDNGTARTIGWGSNFLTSGVAAPLAQTVPNKEHNILFVYSTGSSKWVCMACDAVGY